MLENDSLGGLLGGLEDWQCGRAGAVEQICEVSFVFYEYQVSRSGFRAGSTKREKEQGVLGIGVEGVLKLSMQFWS